jgi:hypothetical protein
MNVEISLDRFTSSNSSRSTKDILKALYEDTQIEQNPDSFDDYLNLARPDNYVGVKKAASVEMKSAFVETYMTGMTELKGGSTYTDFDFCIYDASKNMIYDASGDFCKAVNIPQYTQAAYLNSEETCLPEHTAEYYVK